MNKIFYFSLLIGYIICDYDFEIDEEDTKPEEIGSMQLFDQLSFIMGTNDKAYQSRGEYPKRWEYTKPFKIDRYPVTVADFQNFVKEMRYYTTQPDLNKFSYVFHQHIPKDIIKYDKKLLAAEPWFIPVVGARWDKPFGEYLNISKIKLNPVVHVSFADAHRYCQHLNKRLPTEYEWELAARTNNKSWDYPWGDRMRRNRMNIWQGKFPHHDYGYDGFTHASPVNSFSRQNSFGMYDMLGNVWEWTTTEYIGNDLPSNEIRRHWVVLKGGSFLDTLDGDLGTSPVRCSIKVTRPYYYTAENVGFRCAVDAKIIKKREKKKMIMYEDTHEYRMKIQNLAKKFITLKAKINRTQIQKPKSTVEHKHQLNLKDEL